MATLSVIMPNYNHGRYLRSAILAILRQSQRASEVLVIDDASSDDSIEIVRELQLRDGSIQLVRNEQNLGVISSINRGIAEAKGDFVYCAAADDQILPGLFEKSMSLLSNHPNAKMCIVDLVQFDAVNGTTRPICPRLCPGAGYLSPGEVSRQMARRRFYAYGGMSIIQRKALCELGGMPQELKWYSDWFCVLAIAFRYGTCYIPEPLATMRVLPSSYSASGRKKANVQLAALDSVIRKIRSASMGDILDPIRRSGALAVLGLQVLKVLISNHEYWYLITPRLLVKLLANVPVTILGFNPATPSPLSWLDKLVRHRLDLSGSITRYGIKLEP